MPCRGLLFTGATGRKAMANITKDQLITTLDNAIAMLHAVKVAIETDLGTQRAMDALQEKTVRIGGLAVGKAGVSCECK